MTENAAPTSPAMQQTVLRACGSCMLCCKLFPVNYFDKPAGKWCVHARPGTGCSIHEARPNVCRAFQCEYTTNADFAPNWQPDKAKFFIYRSHANQYMIMVDPGAPHAWKHPDYYPGIKRTAAAYLDAGVIVVVAAGSRRIVVLPDRDEDLGLNAANREIFVDRLDTPQGPVFKVRVGGDDPNPPREPV